MSSQPSPPPWGSPPPQHSAPQAGPGQPAEEWLARKGWVLDAVLSCLAFLVLGLAGLGFVMYVSPAQTAVAVAASVGMPLALACRRRWPVGSAVAVNLLALAQWAVMQAVLPIDLLIYASVYSTTVHAPRWARRASLASAIFGSALVAYWQFRQWEGAWTGTIFMFVALAAPAVIAWALGLLRRSGRVRTESLRERAERLERERDQQAAIAAAAERARIAREMHDVVAHSLSVIIAQADGGRYAARTSPEMGVAALETIAGTARGALADTRRILGVLRSEDGVADAQTAPQPGLGALGELVGTVRESGLAVDIVTWGDGVPLTPAADLALYRVCQEALTNVLKHAGAPGQVSARVDIAWHPEALVVQIDDDGRGAASRDDGAGNGLLGMRERIALFSGGLESGPRPGGGWRVKATVPLAAVARGTIGG